MTAVLRLAGLIFDLDGTLVDSLQDIALSINLTRKRYGMPALPSGEIIARVGDGAEPLVRATVPLDPQRLPEAVAAYLAVYEQHVLDHTQLMPGVARLLERLQDRRLGVITNKHQRLADRVLEGLGVRARFALVLGGDSVPRRKPDPYPIERFLAETGLAPRQVAMIGDGVNDVRAGRSAGVVTIAVTYGVASREALLAEKPEYLVDSVAALGDLLG